MGSIVVDFIPESLPAIILYDSLGNVAILSTVGAHLLINMEEAMVKGQNEGMSSSAVSGATVSGMDFAAAPAQTPSVSHVDDEEGMMEEIEMAEV